MGVFDVFLNCTNDIKSRNAPYLMTERVKSMCLQVSKENFK